MLFARLLPRIAPALLLLPLLLQTAPGVQIREYYYAPTNLVIAAGDTVRWTNNGVQSHDVAEGPVTLPAGITRLFDSPLLGSGSTFAWTFTNVGFYPYYCTPHIAAFPQQTGTVTVLPPMPANVGAALLSPPDGRRFTNAFTVQLVGNGASRNTNITRLEFYANDTLAGSDTTYPYSIFATNLPAGPNQITVVAVDANGTRGTSAPVAIVLTNIITTNVITMSASAFSPISLAVSAGSTVIWSNTQAIAHTAVGTNSLEPLCGAGQLLTTTVRCTNVFLTPGVFPYFCSIHPTMRGTVFVAQAASAPLVTLTRPANSATLTTNGPIVLEAAASDPQGLGRVQFFRAPNTLLGQRADPPWSITASGLPAGQATFFARAVDSDGNVNVSAPVTVNLINAVPLQLLGATNLGANLQFDLTTTPGLTYVTERTSSLPSGFNPFQTNAATGSFIRVTDPIPSGVVTQRFYRAYIQQ